MLHIICGQHASDWMQQLIGYVDKNDRLIFMDDGLYQLTPKALAVFDWLTVCAIDPMQIYFVTGTLYHRYFLSNALVGNAINYDQLADWLIVEPQYRVWL